ncbi:MAG: hypothetical protein IT201_06565 [Thermoleophilia bacterium]|nr:hypothetical protein [Thermoleophilia bacterium]
MLLFTLVFLVLLKIPVVYLCYVVWWAVKDPPPPGGGYPDAEDDPGASGHDPGARGWRPPRRAPRSGGPHGLPARRPGTVPARQRVRARA